MRVLLAEDDPVSRHLLQVSLSNSGYEVAIAVDGAEALQALQQPDGPKLAILDWMMPQMDGVNVCRALRKRGPEPYVYIVLVTAKGQKEEILEGLEAGADDYITKPFDLHELKARLRAGRRILDLQEELISAREELRFQATHDALTGLWGRAAALGILERELARASREGAEAGIVMADLDHFKRINDTLGHAAGDAVLCEAARRMSASVRVYDSVARYGGEEFLIVLPGCNAANTLRLAERIRAAITADSVSLGERSIPITMSLGVVSGGQAQGAPALLRAADAALYRAKRGGRNRVEPATPADFEKGTVTGPEPSIPAAGPHTGFRS